LCQDQGQVMSCHSPGLYMLLIIPDKSQVQFANCA
jgi:hypothetical protein